MFWKTPVPVWVICEVLPCMGGAFMTFPPSAWPMLWWPRQMPSSGMLVLAMALIKGRQIPALSGLLGPGERMIFSGLRARISSTVFSSLRMTVGGWFSCPQYCVMLKVKLS